MMDEIEQQIYSAKLQELGLIEEKIDEDEELDFTGSETGDYDER